MEDNHEDGSGPIERPPVRRLPPIQKRGTIVFSDQIRIELYPRKDEYNPRPDIDCLRLIMTSVEGGERKLDMTPCEALEIGAALGIGVQWFLYNQLQYRKEILEPRLRLGNTRRRQAIKKTSKKPVKKR